MEKKAIILKVFGRVQGVGFRYYTQKKANELNIFGFVQNMLDGSVYIEAEGQEENLNTFIDWVSKGPSWARVRQVQKQWVPVKNYTEFEIR